MDMEAEEVLIRLDRISERRIQEAIDAGAFDNLEGAGKPLKLDDNPFVPEEMRVAFKVLQNSGFAPDWIVLSQHIDDDIQRLRHTADRHFVYLRRRLNEVSGNPYAVKRLRTEVERLKNEHKRAAKQHSLVIEEINRKISSFNQMVPIGSLLKVPLSLSVEMGAYKDRVPAYLSYV